MGNTGTKRILQTGADMAMTVLLPLIMARSLTGGEAHEWLGTAMVVLFAAHHILNRRWYGALLRGKYRPVRVLHTAVNFLLLADMLCLAVSGVVLSAHVFSFLHLTGGAAAARLVHLPAAFWGFLLMSFHLGLHWPAVLSRLREAGRIPRIIARVLALLLSAWGLFAFFRHRFPDYLFLRSQFLFFDYDQAPAAYLFDMATVIVLFAALGYLCVKRLSKTDGRGEG